MTGVVCELCLALPPNENRPPECQLHNAIKEVPMGNACKGCIESLVRNEIIVFCITDGVFVNKDSKEPGKVYEENVEAILANYV